MKRVVAIFAVAAAAIISSPAIADVTIDITQGATGVGVNVSGSLDTSALDYFFTGATLQFTDIGPRFGELAIDNEADTDVYILPAFTLQSFGSGSFSSGSYVSGEFSVESNASVNDYMLLPAGYSSGDPISAAGFYSGATFASLGITPTDFSESLAGGQTINTVFSIASPAPEPDTWALTIVGVGLVGAALRYRRKLTGRPAMQMS